MSHELIVRISNQLAKHHELLTTKKLDELSRRRLLGDVVTSLSTLLETVDRQPGPVLKLSPADTRVLEQAIRIVHQRVGRR